MKEIYTWNNEKPVCPYCGYENENYVQHVEIDGEEEELKCNSCERIFICELNINEQSLPIISYNSWKKKKTNK